MSERIKQVIVMRSDLGMRRGKEAAQASHASGEVLWAAMRGDSDSPVFDLLDRWRNSGMTKICVRVESEEKLLELQLQAEKSGVLCHLITDSGRTEFGGVPTKTCLALGPDVAERIDAITGGLKLY